VAWQQLLAMLCAASGAITYIDSKLKLRKLPPNTKEREELMQRSSEGLAMLLIFGFASAVMM